MHIIQYFFANHNIRLSRLVLMITFLAGLSTIVSARFYEDFGHVGSLKKLQGQAREGDDTPIPQAEIKVTNLKTGRTFSLVANQQGKFEKNRLPKGKYQIVVDAKGHNISGFTININMPKSTAQKKYVIVRLSPGCASGNSGAALVNKINSPSL